MDELRCAFRLDAILRDDQDRAAVRLQPAKFGWRIGHVHRWTQVEALALRETPQRRYRQAEDKPAGGQPEGSGQTETIRDSAPHETASSQATLRNEQIGSQHACGNPGRCDGLGRHVEARHDRQPGRSRGGQHHRQERENKRPPQRGSAQRKHERRPDDELIGREHLPETRQGERTANSTAAKAGKEQPITARVQSQLLARDERQ